MSEAKVPEALLGPSPGSCLPQKHSTQRRLAHSTWLSTRKEPAGRAVLLIFSPVSCGPWWPRPRVHTSRSTPHMHTCPVLPHRALCLVSCFFLPSSTSCFALWLQREMVTVAMTDSSHVLWPAMCPHHSMAPTHPSVNPPHVTHSSHKLQDAF